MPTNTPRLGLPKGNGADNSRDYLKGAISGGGLWHALEVLDDAVLQSSVNTLNDVTLTSPNIGAAEWTDAQHTHASAATAGSTLGPGTTLSTPALQTPAVSGVMTFGGDATLQRTGAGIVAVAPAAGVVNGELDLSSGTTAGTASLLWKSVASPRWLFQMAPDASNSPLILYDYGVAGAGFIERARWEHTGTLSLNPDGGQAAIVTPGSIGSDATVRAGGVGGQYNVLDYYRLQHYGGGSLEFWMGNPTPSKRAVINGFGTLSLTPDALQPALTWNGSGNLTVEGGHPELFASTGVLWVRANGGNLAPFVDNNVSNGGASNRWTAVYAVAGTINTSAAELKQDITPLAPAAALAAVLATDPVVFDYRPPERDATYYELPDDPEQAQEVLYQRLTGDPLMAAARHQAGFVLASPDYATDPLFETGAGQSNAANSVGILLAALHELTRRLEALEGA